MKKPSVVSFLITLLFTAAVCTHGREYVKDKDGKEEYVTDKDGNKVKVDEQYFIQPVKTESNNGGGLFPAINNISSICPLGITQTLHPNQPGLPLIFNYPIPVIFRYPYWVMEPNVPITIYVNIEFKSDIWPVCDDYSKYWKVDDSSSAIVIGGFQKEESTWFKIEKAGEGAGANTYKLTTLTGTVGTIPGPYLRAPQLAVTNDNAKTLLVKFSKVDDATTAAT